MGSADFATAVQKKTEALSVTETYLFHLSAKPQNSERGSYQLRFANLCYY